MLIGTYVRFFLRPRNKAPPPKKKKQIGNSGYRLRGERKKIYEATGEAQGMKLKTVRSDRPSLISLVINQ